MDNDNSKIFSKNFIILASINVFIYMAYFMLFVISSPYALERFNVVPSIAGLVAGLMVIGCLLGRFVTGHFITILGGRKVLFAGIIIYSCSMALYFAAYTLELLILVRFLSGVGVGCVGTAVGTIIAYIVPPGRRGLGISYFTMSNILALALGPFLGIFLLQYTSYEAMFMLCLSFGILSFIVAFTLSINNIIPILKPEERPSLLKLSNYIEYQVVPFSVVVLIACIGWGNVQAFISFHAEATGLVGAASMFFLVYAAVVLLTRPVSGKIFDRRGENMVIYPALALMALGLLILGLAKITPMILLSGALVGAGFGNFQSTGQATALKLVSPERYGQATSTFFIFLDFGIGFGPFLSGFIVPMVGYGGMFVASAAVVLLALVLYYFLHGHRYALDHSKS